jgi:hypothetical protein
MWSLLAKMSQTGFYISIDQDNLYPNIPKLKSNSLMDLSFVQSLVTNQVYYPVVDGQYLYQTKDPLVFSLSNQSKLAGPVAKDCNFNGYFFIQMLDVIRLTPIGTDSSLCMRIKNKFIFSNSFHNINYHFDCGLMYYLLRRRNLNASNSSQNANRTQG